MIQKTKTKKNVKKNIKKNIKKYTKNKSKTRKFYKQNGYGFLNNISGNIFTNKPPQPQTQTNTKYKNQKDIITIIYNRDTPKTIIINNTSPNNLYQSSFVQTVPNIQMRDYSNHYNSHYLLVTILPGIQPKLLWAIDITGGAKSKSILDYYLPRYRSQIRFKILFKLYKYPKNITETFKVANNMTKERHTVFNELKTYLTKNNMLYAHFFKEVNVVQDKGQNISQFLTFLAK